MGSEQKPDRQFPIMAERGGRLGTVPWALLARHEAQAMENHCGQTLEVLASRGGLSAQEAMACIQGVPFSQRRWK